MTNKRVRGEDLDSRLELVARSCEMAIAELATAIAEIEQIGNERVKLNDEYRREQ